MTETGPGVQAKPRGGLILVLGILAFLFGPLTGVPGWIMANQDLRDIRDGFIAPSAQGRLMLGKTVSIIGTFCSVVTLVLLLIAAMVLFVIVQVVLEMAVS